MKKISNSKNFSVFTHFFSSFFFLHLEELSRIEENYFFKVKLNLLSVDMLDETFGALLQP